MKATTVCNRKWNVRKKYGYNILQAFTQIGFDLRLNYFKRVQKASHYNYEFKENYSLKLVIVSSKLNRRQNSASVVNNRDSLK